MPLLDHFHAPLSVERHWESFHASWATKIADTLTEQWLPPNYIAEEHVHIGPAVEIDVGTLEGEALPVAEAYGGIATARAKLWTPPPAELVLPLVFPDTFEIRVLNTDAGPKLVAAIELISPGNKDRASERRAFATKCASYLYQGISLILVDIVTNRRANLHNEMIELMELADDNHLPPEVSLYAVAYRPLRRDGKDEMNVWRVPLALDKPLPELPLGLSADLTVPVDFEGTYAEACRRKRIAGS